MRGNRVSESNSASLHISLAHARRGEKYASHHHPLLHRSSPPLPLSSLPPPSSLFVRARHSQRREGTVRILGLAPKVSYRSWPTLRVSMFGDGRTLGRTSTLTVPKQRSPLECSAADPRDGAWDTAKGVFSRIPHQKSRCHSTTFTVALRDDKASPFACTVSSGWYASPQTAPASCVGNDFHIVPSTPRDACNSTGPTRTRQSWLSPCR